MEVWVLLRCTSSFQCRGACQYTCLDKIIEKNVIKKISSEYSDSPVRDSKWAGALKEKTIIKSVG